MTNLEYIQSLNHAEFVFRSCHTHLSPYWAMEQLSVLEDKSLASLQNTECFCPRAFENAEHCSSFQADMFDELDISEYQDLDDFGKCRLCLEVWAGNQRDGL